MRISCWEYQGPNSNVRLCFSSRFLLCSKRRAYSSFTLKLEPPIAAPASSESESLSSSSFRLLGLDDLLFEAALSAIGPAILKTESTFSSRRIEKLETDAGETDMYGKKMLQSSDRDPHLQQKLRRRRTFFFCRQIKPKKFGGELSELGVTFGRTTTGRVPPKTLLTVTLPKVPSTLSYRGISMPARVP